ncbi:MAG TPA: saccharopine dehydrogenase C-terminal domain-containing protein [Myxococcota bacterium]|nr:saccharopine dehydrogenase C-terminal domain-containing protein [Myxococcota bacterium]HRY95849.1 saccharopine dehydrogenase C-terminal domain-containing protein [Myxococcota bacterium]
MKRIGVLGCGLVGATIARDLSEDGRYRVTAADRDTRRLEGLARRDLLEPAQADLGSPEAVARFIAPFDVVVGALPSRFGFQTLRTVLEARKPYCDISFMPEGALALDGLARERGVCAVVDCGVAPGLANLLIGHAHALFERTDSAVFYVGGLPRVRRWPWEYKAPFAPADVLEEYTRPARMKVGGRVVALPALSEPELVDIPQVGHLEAFNTDGLRSLLETIDAPELREKTMRYPGHAALMRALRDSGFLDPAPVEVGGVKVSPLALSSKLLFESWRLLPGEPEFTSLRVIVEGLRAGARERRTYELFDETDAARGESSMARTTGFPCALVARLLAEGELAAPGVLPPELLATRPGLYERILAGLRERGVEVSERIEALA